MSSIHRDQSHVEEDASLGFKGIDEVWNGAHPLWNAEVLLILNNHAKHVKDSSNRIPTSSAATQKLFKQTLDYVGSLNNYHSQVTVNEARALADQYPGIDVWEFALMNNLRLDDYDECIALIPTLKAKIDRNDSESNDGNDNDNRRVGGTHHVDREMVEKVLSEMKRFQTTT